MTYDTLFLSCREWNRTDDKIEEETAARAGKAGKEDGYEEITSRHFCPRFFRALFQRALVIYPPLNIKTELEVFEYQTPP